MRAGEATPARRRGLREEIPISVNPPATDYACLGESRGQGAREPVAARKLDEVSAPNAW